LSPSEGWSQDNCSVCHGESKDERLRLPVMEWEESVHKAEGIGCNNCHGGDPESKGKTTSHLIDFIGKPAREKIPEICGGCHVKQIEDYSKNIHAKLLNEKKEERGASCIDCHGRHKIKRIKDNESSVYYLNVPETCGKCHSSSEKMKSYGPTNQFDLYKSGKHGLILYGKIPEAGRTSAPNCAACHGYHTSLISSPQDIPRICGKCHTPAFDNFKEGLHFSALKKSGKPSCSYCHSNHKIIRPAPEIFSGFNRGECGECHDKSSNELKVGLNIKEIMGRLEEIKLEVSNNIEDVRRYGRNTADLENLFTEVSANILMVPPVSHSLDLDKINEYVNKITKTSQEVKGKVEEFKREISRRYMVYAVSMIMIFTAVIVLSMQLYIYKRAEK
jgi:nitrate/TMAO reductase-like tetraheme cytochrome c subunit